MIKRIEGKTPNGGIYATIAFFDINNNLTNELNAKNINIKEYDKNDNEIMETWGIINSNK